MMVSLPCLVLPNYVAPRLPITMLSFQNLIFPRVPNYLSCCSNGAMRVWNVDALVVLMQHSIFLLLSKPKGILCFDAVMWQHNNKSCCVVAYCKVIVGATAGTFFVVRSCGFLQLMPRNGRNALHPLRSRLHCHHCCIACQQLFNGEC
jgi:hypothetical protein